VPQKVQVLVLTSLLLELVFVTMAVMVLFLPNRKITVSLIQQPTKKYFSKSVLSQIGLLFRTKRMAIDMRIVVGIYRMDTVEANSVIGVLCYVCTFLIANFAVLLS
jgi:hypothetical protein